MGKTLVDQKNVQFRSSSAGVHKKYDWKHYLSVNPQICHQWERLRIQTVDIAFQKQTIFF